MKTPPQHNDDRLELEFERFVEFGRLLDRKMRRYLVQYLQNQLDPQRHVLPALEEPYYRYFQRAIDRLFATSDLLPLCRNNERIGRQVMLDTIQWLRKAHQKAEYKNPWKEELNRLENWAITPLRLFAERWHILVMHLQMHYPQEELDTGFYRQRFEHLLKGASFDQLSVAARDRLSLLFNDLLAQWDALLQARVLEDQLRRLDEELEPYLQLIEAKVSEYTRLVKLISPFTEYLGWDMSRALWQDTSLDLIQQYNDILRDDDAIRELADLLGKLREADMETEQEELEKNIIRQQWVIDEHTPAEVTGIRQSADLSRLLSAEAALLPDEDTELLFLKKYADQQLFSFRYEDRRLERHDDHVSEIYQRVRQRKKGPFIICVDTSESMIGRPEQIAKVLALAILKMAMREDRRAYLINFSVGIKTLDLYDIANSVDTLAAFLRMSFHGGTDISLPLFEAVRQLRTHAYQDADVLVVSDFIMYRINKDVLAEVRHFQQNHGVQFHSLTLSRQPDTFILQHFDTNWLYDPEQRGVVKDLGRALRGL